MRLNIISTLFAIVGFSASIFGQDSLDCRDFKTGRFHYIPPNGGEVTIRRTKKKQIERYNDENQKFIFEINWLDDCSYDLVLVNAKGLPKEKKKEIIGTQLHCRVVAVSLGHYEIEISEGASSKVEELTIFSNR
ncbi:hypothetical protein [Parvicella tangerina]|uniref:hypothetical protein n=1 Tax=Parvicella tangerina TaxID=2829795 RepID=UPI00215BE318|nr:hypothetical protein [Parvicella tangerina]